VCGDGNSIYADVYETSLHNPASRAFVYQFAKNQHTLDARATDDDDGMVDHDRVSLSTDTFSSSSRLDIEARARGYDERTS